MRLLLSLFCSLCLLYRTCVGDDGDTVNGVPKAQADFLESQGLGALLSTDALSQTLKPGVLPLGVPTDLGSGNGVDPSAPTEPSDPQNGDNTNYGTGDGAENQNSGGNGNGDQTNGEQVPAALPFPQY